jgi:hypothetical protein
MYMDKLLTFSSLLATGEFSDFIIKCGDKTWNVHKAIVCTQSDVFAAASKFGKVSKYLKSCSNYELSCLSTQRKRKKVGSI